MNWHFCTYIYFVIPSILLCICNLTSETSITRGGLCPICTVAPHKRKLCHFYSVPESYILTKLSHVLIQLRSSIYHRSLQMFFRPCLLFVYSVEMFMSFDTMSYFVLVLQFVILPSDFAVIIIVSFSPNTVKMILFCVSWIQFLLRFLAIYFSAGVLCTR